MASSAVEFNLHPPHDLPDLLCGAVLCDKRYFCVTGERQQAEQGTLPPRRQCQCALLIPRPYKAVP